MKIGLGQLDIELGQPERNVEQVRNMAEQAAAAGCELLVLPELWSSGYALEQAQELAAPLNQGVFATVSELAQQYNLAICGSLLEARAEGVFNTATVYAADGSLQHVYRKIHLIGLMHEDRFLQPGASAEVNPKLWDGTALAICYDLRFPELFRRYALAGARLVLIPAEWPIQRIEHWRTLLRARAIENQCVIVACNRVGRDHANTFGGASVLLDAWGQTIVEGGTEAGLLIGEIELDHVQEARTFLPVFADRRPEYYGE